MKTIKFIIPSMLVLLSITSCNSSSFKRVVYQEKSFEDAKAVHEKIKSNQKDEQEVTKLFDKGTLDFKYTLKADGSLRYDDLSFHNIDINLSSNYSLDWSLTDNYLRVKGEKEVHYFIFKDNKYWQLEKYMADDEEIKEKIDRTSIVTEEFDGSFKNYIEYCINYYTTLSIPFMFNITAGITGEQVEPDLPIFETNFDYCPDFFFDQENYNILKELSEKYAKDTSSGYSLSTIYGVDNDTATCLTLKGKVNLNDFHETKYRKGTMNIDAFVSYKDNYISQFEVKMDAKSINTRKVNVNVNSDIYMSEQVTKDKCEIDDYGDISQYREVDY